MSRFHINPRKIFVRTRFNYEKLPGGDSQSSSPLFNTPIIKSFKQRNPWATRLQRPRLSFARLVTLFVTAVVLASMLGTGIYKRHQRHQSQHKGEERKLYHWEHYPR
jgi:hypothetical protein